MVCRRSSVRGATRWRHRAVRGQDDRRADRRLPVRKGGEGRQRWLALPKLSCGSRALLSRIRRDAWRSRSSGDGTCCGAQSAASVAPSRSACSSGRAIRVARRSCPSSFGLAVDQGVVEGDAAGLMLWLGVLAVVYVGLSFSFRYGARAGERASLTAAHLLRVALVERVLAPEGGAEDGRLPGELANWRTGEHRHRGRQTGRRRVHGRETAAVCLQGGTEHTHGLASTLLSTTAVRAGEICGALFADRAARTSRTDSAA